MLKYNKRLIIETPIEFTYSYYSNPKNFKKLSLLDKRRKTVLLDEVSDLEKPCQVNNIYKFQVTHGAFILDLNAITTKVEKNKAVGYKYAYKDVHAKKDGFMKNLLKDPHEKNQLLMSFNNNPFTTEWHFKSIDQNTTEAIYKYDVLGKMNIFFKLITWFYLKVEFWGYRKYWRMLKETIEEEYKEKNDG